MAHYPSDRTPKAADPREAATQLASSGHVEVLIDLDELQQAREDERLGSLLAAAEAEGACVEREGRQRW
jgi:hypothetical protein